METSNSFRPLVALTRKRELATVITILAALWIVLAIAGCAKKTETGNAVESTSSATTPPESTSTTSATLAAINDANIIAALSEGDSAEIALGKLALDKSKSSKVKDFAKMMITDHGKMKTEKADLAKKLNITPQPPANDAGPAHLTAELSALNAATSPVAFDSTYINQAVADHTDALATVKDFETKASAPELKDALKKAEPIIQAHLDRAKALQAGQMRVKPIAMGKKAR